MAAGRHGHDSPIGTVRPSACAIRRNEPHGDGGGVRTLGICCEVHSLSGAAAFGGRAAQYGTAPASRPMTGSAGQVERLACLELRGGNHLATYAARLPGLTAWVSCNPLRPSRRGGDLYYLSACSHGSIARVVIADVSGHGEKVSAAAVRLQHALRQHIDLWDQSVLIRDLNESFFRDEHHVKFATAFLGSFASESGDLLFTNAGHMLPTLLPRRDSRSGVTCRISCRSRKRSAICLWD